MGTDPNPSEIRSLLAIATQIRHYVDQKPGKNVTPKPFSILILGEPGSGKSFVAKEVIAEAMNESIANQLIEANLTQLSDEGDFPAVLEDVRSRGIRTSIPVVIWDEYDAPKDGQEFGWIPKFLAPMQDGRYWTANGFRPLGKAIFVFAGGILNSAEQFHATDADTNRRRMKLPDFISRIKCIHTLQSTTANSTEAERQRAILIDSLLRKARGDIESVEDKVMNRLFDWKYRHGARSMEAIISGWNVEYIARMVSGGEPKSLIDVHIDNA
jgi:hypothetical protein